MVRISNRHNPRCCLRRLKANVIGLALNEVRADMSERYYYYGYYGRPYYPPPPYYAPGYYAPPYYYGPR